MKGHAYKSWNAMRERCDRPTHRAYKYYGGRGITYDPAWAVFANFKTDMGSRPPDTSLDRIDPNGDYCKENCRWVTKDEQLSNKRGVAELQKKLAAAFEFVRSVV